MNTDTHWTAYLTALLTPTVAVLGSYVAYRQWRLARNKLKLDLFDRRLTIYTATQTFLGSVISSGQAKQEAVIKFLIATREAKWLLDASVAQYLEHDIYRRAVELQTLASELEGEGVGDIRTKNVHDQANIKKWLFSQIDSLDERFSTFLQLQH